MDDSRPVLVGMNNPISMRPEHALYPAPEGCSGHRLWRLLHEETGATRLQYIDRFCRINLVVGQWDRRRARLGARELLPSLLGRDVVVLGQKVREAFDLPDRPTGESFHFGGARFYFLPHPSGRNLWYNSEANRQIARQLLGRLYLQETNR